MGNRFFFAAFLILLFGRCAQALDYTWNLHYDLRYGYHLLAPEDLATDRHMLETEQKFTTGSWTLVGSLRAFVEAAYATNSSRYQGPVVQNDSQEIRLRDLYLQYKHGHFLIRLGNQQVVWGESFGFYYADIVNPKDLRELGIGDLAANRLQVPMLNANFIYGDYSLQAIYIPKPFFDIIPSQGSDFAAPFFSRCPSSHHRK